MSKLKTKISLKLLICTLIVVVLATLLVACNDDEADHADHYVTFSYNLGNIKGEAPDQYLSVYDNALISIRPGYSNDFSEPVIAEYYLEGWYLPADLDADGNPVKDENGFVLLGEEWDFKTERVHSDITLYGKWLKKTVMHFIDRKTGDEVHGRNGNIMSEPGGRTNEPTESYAPTLSGHTFLGKYYVAQTGTQEFKWPYTFGTEDVYVYVEFLEGVWSLVDTVSGFRTAMAAGRNIYLQNDLDFENKPSTVWSLGSYNGEINGNGHTIKNVKRSFAVSRNKNINLGGVFGTLGAQANIHDIIFDNINVELEIVDSLWNPIDVYAGLFAWSAEEGAKVSNVTLRGSLSYDLKGKDGVTVNALIGNNEANESDFTGCDFTGAVLNELK